MQPIYCCATWRNLTRWLHDSQKVALDTHCTFAQCWSMQLHIFITSGLWSVVGLFRCHRALVATLVATPNANANKYRDPVATQSIPEYQFTHQSRYLYTFAPSYQHRNPRIMQRTARFNSFPSTRSTSHLVEVWQSHVLVRRTAPPFWLKLDVEHIVRNIF
jgi:hypothetical protein